MLIPYKRQELTPQLSTFFKTLCEFSFYVYLTMPFLPSFLPSPRTWSPQSCFNTSRSRSSSTTSINTGNRKLPPYIYSRYHHKKGYTLIHCHTIVHTIVHPISKTVHGHLGRRSASMPKSHQAKHVAMCPGNPCGAGQRDARNRIANAS